MQKHLVLVEVRIPVISITDSGIAITDSGAIRSSIPMIVTTRRSAATLSSVLSWSPPLP